MRWVLLLAVLCAALALRWPRDLGPAWATVTSAETEAQVDGPVTAVAAALADGRSGSFEAVIGTWEKGPGELICAEVTTRWLSGDLLLSLTDAARCGDLRQP